MWSNTALEKKAQMGAITRNSTECKNMCSLYLQVYKACSGQASPQG